MISRQRKNAIRTAIAITLLGSAAAMANELSDGVKVDKNLRTLDAAYGFTTSVICATTDPQAPGTPSIDADTGTFLVGGEAVNFTGGGVMTFTRDGKVTLLAPGTQLETNKIIPGGVPFTTSITGTCAGNYNIQFDKTSGNTLNASYNCVLDVPTRGLKINVGPIIWAAHIGPFANEIHGVATQNVQTIQVALRANGQVVAEEQRICEQTVALDKLFL